MHIKPQFLPTQKEEQEPFHSEPILKGVERETLETITFSDLSQDKISSRSSIQDCTRLRKGPILVKGRGRRWWRK